MTPQQLAEQYNREILRRKMRKKDTGEVYEFVSTAIALNNTPYNLKIMLPKSEDVLVGTYKIQAIGPNVILYIGSNMEYAIMEWLSPEKKLKITTIDMLPTTAMHRVIFEEV